MVDIGITLTMSHSQTTAATGFSSATLVLSGFVLVGLILSMGLAFIKNKRPVSSAEEVVKA